VNWGSSTEAQTYKTTLASVYTLNQTNEHVKNYRPQLLVLSSNPAARPALIDFANLMTKNLALMMLGRISRVSKHSQK
jgi:solute carrier family 12 sodium/potassium/chloride transporter 2